MHHTLITGSNRGIGLEMTRQILRRGGRVWATCRQPDEAAKLRELSARFPRLLNVHRLDIRNNESIEAAVRKVQDETHALDLLINNAAILVRDEHLQNLDREIFRQTMDINAIGAVFLAQSSLKLLQAGNRPKIANITSQLGSIARKQSGSLYSYSASKAAMNMISRIMSIELRPIGITVLAIHPGWVRTDMGGAAATLSVEESAAGVLSVIRNAGLADSGRFLTWDNRELPW